MSIIQFTNVNKPYDGSKVIKNLNIEIKRGEFVTHDIEEALKLGSKIVLLKDGSIEQLGSKDNLIFFPKSDFVKDFFGIKGF